MSSSPEGRVADTDIAVIGMAGRFPGADDLDAYWRLLSEGREGTTRFTREELAAAGVPEHLLADPEYVPTHGVIPDVELFDTGYFEFTPAEAEFTDPQHRVLLTSGHAALEHAGYDASRFPGLISVYAGAAINTYLQQQVLPRVDQTTTSQHFAVMVGNDKDFLATRLSYKLDLRGPSYTVQTACSTSLVAIHLACQGLINGECDMALAGGVTVKLPQTKGYLYEEGAILSRDGHVRAFDADASGTVLGNGVGVVVLKPLRDALADRDTVHAVIKATATNNDGSGKVSFAAPGAAGQTAVVREAHTVAGVPPRSISYLEAHGTATRLGDPVEVSALTRAFRAHTQDTGFCTIGSVKSNIGHLDAAAGVAGLLKTVLMMKHRTLVPTLNHQNANPAIDFAAGPFKVGTDTTDWTAPGPLRAGVSSFGIGGTNAHAVVEEAPPSAPTSDSRGTQVLVLSARTPSALRTAADQLAAHLEEAEPAERAGGSPYGRAALADIAYTLAVGRRAHEYRLAVSGEEAGTLARALRDAGTPDRPAGADVVFSFPAELPNASDLAEGWAAAEPRFAAYLCAAREAGAAEHGAAGETFAAQYALGCLWREWGLRPAAVHGQGPGALAAACVAGALELSAAIAALAAEEPADLADGAGDIPFQEPGESGEQLVLEPSDGPWAAVARAWAAGAPVDWTAWFADEERGRVPLPTYPFEGRRCWMEGTASGSQDPRLAGQGPREAGQGPSKAGQDQLPAGPRPHPMLAENLSTLDTVAHRVAPSGEDFYVADHRVNGEPVVPAAAMLELARAAGEFSLGQPVSVHGVSFEQLLSGTTGAGETLVELWRPDGDDSAATGESAVAFEIADQDRVYASGALSPIEPGPATKVELADPETFLGAYRASDAAYAELRALGLDYGPRMRALRAVSTAEDVAVGTLAPPEGSALPGAVMHPALLDGALHALVLLLTRRYGAAAAGFLPLALEELVVHAPVVAACRVRVELDAAGDRTARADLTLQDMEGSTLATLHGLTVRVLTAPVRPELLVRAWGDAPPVATTDVLAGPALVVAAEGARRDLLAAHLDALGVTEATTAPPTAPLPAPEADGTATVPATVILDEPAPDEALRLVRGLLAARPSAPVRVLLLHRHEQAGPRPERAALGAFARTVRAENPLLRVQAVGLTAETDERAALTAELAGEGRDSEVLHTPTGRQVPHAVPAPDTAPVELRDGGVYLVTGGTGGLGRLVTSWLLDRVDARVVLLSRGTQPPEDLDPRAVHRSADVGDPEALATCLDAVRAEFGPLNGVVHAAGVLRDGFALNKTDADLAAVLAPKTVGLRALDDATASDPLDFFLTFSSIAAHIGNAGQSDYAYANAYLEAYAERVPRITAVAWPLWAEGGMRQSAQDAADIAERTGFHTLPTEVGLQLLERALTASGAVVAAYGDLGRITSVLGAPTDQPASRTAADAQDPAPAAADGTDARDAALELLTTLIAGETGLDREELVEDAPFDRYGIDSLMISRLNRELERHVSGLSKTLFFEYATLGELADHFVDQHADALRTTPAAATPAAATAVPEPAVASGRPRRTTRRGRTSPAEDTDQAVAIVGMAGRYPMADDLDEFWDNLVAGRDCVTEIPADRWDHTRWYDPDPAVPGRAHTRWGGFLRDVDRFDPLFFGISPRQAEVMDPQERLFLQNAWHVLEDSGYRPAELRGLAVGVYVGVMYGEYQFHGALDALRGGRQLTGSSFATIANRVSHALDLSGPSMALDTMCSSSLTAIHLACESLRRGESELALAGGVNVSVHPYKYAFLSQGRFLSSDGRCRAFGAGGDGYVPGEGVGAVLLKPYRRALEDGDRIHGVILGSALNHGARTNGYTVPNPHAQARVISAALTQAGVAADDIDYVEAHGTGTALGDPIELNGLTRAFEASSADRTVRRTAIGSVKSSVGHLESAAGMAGLTKVLLQFAHGTLAPSLHADEPNPNIDFAHSPFRVQREAAHWPPGDRPRRAALSSFGAGGSNAHLILEEPPAAASTLRTVEPAAEQTTAEPVLLLLSARDEERLRVYASRAADFLENAHVPLADLCFTSQTGREPMPARLAVHAADGARILAALRDCATDGVTTDLLGEGPLTEPARRWLAGEEVDWAAVHAERPGPMPRRVSAPLYPFASERYWIPLDPDLGAAPPHPLVDANESTVEGLRFRRTFRPGEQLVRDHVIEGRQVVAGTVLLEFVRAAATLALPQAGHTLRDVVFGRPVETNGAPVAVYVSFRLEGDGLAFEVHTVDGQASTAHIRGVASPLADEGIPEPDAAAAEALRSAFATHRDGLAAYADYTAAGFAYGPSYQVIQEVHSGPGEALLRLRRTSGEGGAALLEASPELLDGALRACHWAGRSELPAPGGLEVPFSVGSYEVYAPFPELCLAHARLVGESTGVRRFDVTLRDEQGRTLAVVRDFAGRSNADASATLAPSQPRPADGEALLYEPYWRPEPAPAPGGAARTLALVGVSEELGAALAATGGWQRVATVTRDGDGFGARLLELAGQDGLDVVFGPAEGESPARDDAEPAVLDELGGKLLDLLAAVHADGLGGRVRCVIPHVRDEWGERPGVAALAGFARSTALVPRLELLTLGADTGTAADELAAALVAELDGAPSASGLDVRRTDLGAREVRALRRVTAPPAPDSGRLPLRDGGTYVLTGGGGALGGALAEHLASARQARLVLIGRSQPDAAARQHHAHLESLGAEVLAVCADVTRPAELGEALDTARERFGQLHGVFHLAGMADDGRATDGDLTRFLRVLAAKTHGVAHLDQLTSKDPLDVFAVFSSVASLVGDFGAASYATANRFADLYTLRRATRGDRPGRSLTLAWPLWAAGGVDALVRDAEADASTRRTGMRALSADEACGALELALAHDRTWVLPGWGDPAVVDAALTEPSRPAASAPAAAPSLAAAPAHTAGTTAQPPVADRRERLVGHLREVLAGVLKLAPERLDSRVPLDDYGMDSVLVMESNAVLGADFPGVRGTVFFEERTVDGLADHLIAEHPEAVERLFPAPQAPSVSAAPAAEPATPAVPSRPASDLAPTPAAAADPDHSTQEPIAVIGLSGRYPQAGDLEEFWRNLAEGRDCVTEVPADRWDADALFDADPAAAGRSYGRWGGFLEDVDSFDSLFFQISPKQARTMDPQERLFLETSWAALEDAGYPPSRLPRPRFGEQGHDVGVFVGVMWDDYAILAAAESARGNPQVVLANRSGVANQVSYAGDFRGPSVVVDTACSASLVALHQACESIRRGECSYAIAGGVNVAVHPDKYVHLSRKAMLSADGRCRAFGAGGTGYVPGEGVGAVVLKRLSEAVRDGDTVHAVIRSTAVNHGGRTSGYTVPNPHAQQALVEQALAQAGVDARTIGCVEAHGTGTALGDPIEHTALTQAFATYTKDTGFCSLGSVKSAIGHLEGAAGIAGFTKAVLQLRHGTLLPTLHADEPNQLIDFAGSPFTVQRETAHWPAPQGTDGRPAPRRAAVSSFGAGGTNAHVVLEEYQEPEPTSPREPDGPEMLLLSARDDQRLREYASRLARALADPVRSGTTRLTDVAHTLRVGREPQAERLAFVAADLAEAADRFAAAARGEQAQWLHRGRVEPHSPLSDLLTEGAGGSDFLTARIRAGDDDALARMWVSGITLDWDLIAELRPADRRRVPLPSYPFARIRHWIDAGPASVPPTRAPDPSTVGGASGTAGQVARANAPVEHADDSAGPAVATQPRSRLAAEPDREWKLSEEAAVLRDHVVGDRMILPGTGHLNLVAEACDGLTGRALAEVRWISPVVAAGALTSVAVVRADDRWEVRGPDQAVRSFGRLAPAGPQPAPVDPEELRQRLTPGPEHHAFYRALETKGLSYGPFFRHVEQVWTGAREALGRLVALPGVAPASGATELEAPSYALHPGMLDAALHTVAPLLERGAEPGAGPMMPFAADLVEVFGPVPELGWSHVRMTADDRCDVLLLDDGGGVRVRVTGLIYRRATPTGPALHRPAWRPRSAEDSVLPAAGEVLLVGEFLTGAFATALARVHRSAGARVREVPVGSDGLTEAELDAALAGQTRPELVYFLCGPGPEGSVTEDALRQVENRGVLALHRLVRALDRHREAGRELPLKVVTTGLHPLDEGEESAPWSAAVAGYAAVAAKEIPELRLALVDVRGTEAADIADTVVAEPFPARPAPVSLRGGVRRQRVLERVEPATGPAPFRRGGVYLVIGGMGTVGRDTCRHLAREYGARLVLVGRSPLDEDRRRTLAEWERAGARTRYLELDATDPVALAKAVRTAKEEFGALHGVINAAMVLVNRPLPQLRESELLTALRAKTDGTWSTLEAVRDEPLDFVLLYSSGVVFEANQGQAGYAAGCTFADAYARHAARTLPFPVRVLNLGYWHDGGDPERARILRRFQAAGIRPLTAARGLAAVERALAGGMDQVLALDADDAILENLGVDVRASLAALPPGVSAPAPQVRLPDPRPALPLVEHHRAVAELEELADRLLAVVLARAGLFTEAERGRGAAELPEALGVVAEHTQLFAAQLDMLLEAGWLRRDGETVRPGARPVEDEADLCRAVGELAARHPSVAPVAELLRDCLTALPDLLTGRLSAIELLFPDGSPERVAAIYRGDPVTDRCNAEVARLVVEQVRARRTADAGTPVRVLEVGAGTGGTTTAVLAALAPYGDAVEYVFSDLSPAFVRAARARYAADYPFVRFTALDIEAEAAAGHTAEGGYDVVLGTNVLHATARLSRTLTHVKRLLRGGGVLVATEGTRPLRQLALVFGLTTGWWLSEDPEQRLPRSPLAGERQWRDVLAVCGFRQISTGAPDTGAMPGYQSVLAAVSDGLVPVATSGAVRAEPPRMPAAARTADDCADGAQDGELARVTAVFARVLEMESGDIDPDLTYENYGVDSLVLMELTRALEEEYGPQPATLLFERITVRRLAAHLAADSRAGVPSPTEGQSAPRPADLPAGSPASAPADPTRTEASPLPAHEGDTSVPAAVTQPPAGSAARPDVAHLVAGLSDAAVEELLAELLPGDGEQEGGRR